MVFFGIFNYNIHSSRGEWSDIKIMVHSGRFNDSKHNLGASKNIKAKAGDLRKSMTVAEKVLWERLRNKQLNGMHFRRQHPYNIYILDFYCFEADLAIEIDGEIHLNQKEYDNERTEFLKSTGLKVIRFTNDDIESRIDWVIEVIKDHVNKYLHTSKSFIGTRQKNGLSTPGGNGKGGKFTF